MRLSAAAGDNVQLDSDYSEAVGLANNFLIPLRLFGVVLYAASCSSERDRLCSSGRFCFVFVLVSRGGFEARSAAALCCSTSRPHASMFLFLANLSDHGAARSSRGRPPSIVASLCILCIAMRRVEVRGIILPAAFMVCCIPLPCVFGHRILPRLAFFLRTRFYGAMWFPSFSGSSLFPAHVP
ncbi:hypothetical protein DFH06DRAFT_1239415 [Mycena polygramma]|nr:hypothetical protein DFH06DRAFT_1239415 [Mycena polygramma]